MNSRQSVGTSEMYLKYFTAMYCRHHMPRKNKKMLYVIILQHRHNDTISRFQQASCIFLAFYYDNNRYQSGAFVSNIEEISIHYKDNLQSPLPLPR